jgi:hypothetical protein
MSDPRIKAVQRYRLAKRSGLHLEPITPEEVERLKEQYYAKKLTSPGQQAYNKY